jgi:hypothetical protein
MYVYVYKHKLPVFSDLRDGCDALLFDDLGAVVQGREHTVLQTRLLRCVCQVAHLRHLCVCVCV